MRAFVMVAVAAAGLACAGAASAQEALAKSSGCMNCHDVATKKIGPAFKEIAAKYKGKADAEATIVKAITEGKGHPASKAKPEDVTKMVKWILAM